MKLFFIEMENQTQEFSWHNPFPRASTWQHKLGSTDVNNPDVP